MTTSKALQLLLLHLEDRANKLDQYMLQKKDYTFYEMWLQTERMIAEGYLLLSNWQYRDKRVNNVLKKEKV